MTSPQDLAAQQLGVQGGRRPRKDHQTAWDAGATSGEELDMPKEDSARQLTGGVSYLQKPRNWFIHRCAQGSAFHKAGRSCVHDPL